MPFLAGHPGTSALTFTYTVAGGENSADLDYSATTSLTRNARGASMPM